MPGISLLVLLALSCGIVSFVVFWHLASKNIGENLNRVGISLQIIGLASVIPELVGEKRLVAVESNLRLVRIRRFRKRLDDYLSNRNLDSLFDAQGLTGFVSISSNLLMSVPVITIWVNKVLFPNMLRRIPGEIGAELLGIPCFVWIVLFLMVLLFDVNRKAPPTLLLWLFLSFHLFVSVLSFPLSAAIAFSFKLILQVALAAIITIPLRQIVAWITIPLLLVGAVLQLVATFL